MIMQGTGYSVLDEMGGIMYPRMGTWMGMGQFLCGKDENVPTMPGGYIPRHCHDWREDLPCGNHLEPSFVVAYNACKAICSPCYIIVSISNDV